MNRKIIDANAACISSLQFRRWRNQPVQKEISQQTIPAWEAIQKLEKILDCLNNADRRIATYREMISIFEGLGFRQADIEQYNKHITATKYARLKLKRYFNKVARSIELFRLR